MAIPRPLTEILLVTGVREGADAAVKQYRDLRSQYYGRGAYDFGEETLLTVARRLANARPEVKAAAHWVTKASGGDGAFRELVEVILRSQGLWNAIIKKYQ